MASRMCTLAGIAVCLMYIGAQVKASPTESKLSDAQMEEDVDQLVGDGWTLTPQPDTLSKTFNFYDYGEALAFLTQLAMKVNQMDHYPSICIGPKTVTVKLYTESVGGLSSRDLDIAYDVEMLAAV